MKKITIKDYPIRLGQFLKIINIAQDGLEAKLLILEGSVLVNGLIEKQRGKKLTIGDVVEVEGNDSYLLCG